MFTLLCLLLIAAMGTGCNTTRHVKNGQYLLQSNSLKIKSDRSVTNRGALNDGLASLIIQKPNKKLFVFPYKLYLFNLFYNPNKSDSANYQVRSRTVEPPVVYDSTLRRRSAQNMKSFLFNDGYFYAKVVDSVRLKGRKAEAVYYVETGSSYLLNQTQLDVDDSMVKQTVVASMKESLLTKGATYTGSLLEQERSRLTEVLRNHGYYKFSSENISFILDTVDKRYFRDAENPFESAIDFLALQKAQRKPTLDVRVVIRADDDSTAYIRYKIGRITVYPDFIDRNDIRDSTMQVRVMNNVTFRYHNYYLREPVIYRSIFLETGKPYSQEAYDQTITRLNDLGAFQYVRVYLVEDTTDTASHTLRAILTMNPARRYDFNTNLEVSRAITYAAGSAVGVSVRNRNLFKGANQLTIGLNGGVEFLYDTARGVGVLEHFKTRSLNYSINGALDLPKFLVPFTIINASRRNLPRTVINFGTSFQDRLDYFTLTNTTANLIYNWHPSNKTAWDVSPAFVNIFRLPRITPDFQRRLDTNTFLRNSYRPTFIEGESVAYTFSDNNVRRGRNYSYARVAVEEAGALLSVVGLAVKGLSDESYSNYLKFDFDGRHYFTFTHSSIAMRFIAGVGVPYSSNTSLPYIKQYYVGGPYSLRGWRVRTLGPGSYYNDTASASLALIDRTGDIRLEANTEYRFDIVKLFSGAIQLAGAAFVDAGNIWLARPDPQFPGGEFAISKLGQDIAISSGAGLRLDFGGFITGRLDAGFPVKKPYSTNPGGWVIQDIRFLSSSWRSDNLVLSFAIGLPF